MIDASVLPEVGDKPSTDDFINLYVSRIAEVVRENVLLDPSNSNAVELLDACQALDVLKQEIDERMESTVILYKNYVQELSKTLESNKGEIEYFEKYYRQLFKKRRKAAFEKYKSLLSVFAKKRTAS